MLLTLATISVGDATWQSRQDLIERGLDDAQTVSVIIGNQLQASVDAIDLTLLNLLTHVRRASVEDETELKSLARCRRGVGRN